MLWWVIKPLFDDDDDDDDDDNDDDDDDDVLDSKCPALMDCTVVQLDWFALVSICKQSEIGKKKEILTRKKSQVCQNWGPEGDDEKMTTTHDSDEKKTKDKNHNGQERSAQKEGDGSPKTTLEGEPGIMQKNPDKAPKEELQTSKKELGRNEDPEHETKVSELRLESEDDQGEGEDVDHQANGNHSQGKDEGQQGPNQGQSENEDPRRARLSGLSLTLGRGAVPRALRFRNCKSILITTFLATYTHYGTHRDAPNIIVIITSSSASNIIITLNQKRVNGFAIS